MTKNKYKFIVSLYSQPNDPPLIQIANDNNMVIFIKEKDLNQLIRSLIVMRSSLEQMPLYQPDQEGSSP